MMTPDPVKETSLRMTSTDLPITGAPPSSSTSFTPSFGKKKMDTKFPPVVAWSEESVSRIPEEKLKGILGGKGANLAQMRSMGITVPPGFTISTEVCASFQDNDRALSCEVWDDILKSLKDLERDTNKVFGSTTNEIPLLLSVRSGAAISMPGMMDTVLNLGINDVTVKALEETFGERFALDSYRRLLNMFGNVVLGIEHEAFEKEMSEVKKSAGVELDNQLTAPDLRNLIARYKAVYQEHNKVFPQDPYEQLYYAISAVFDSWGSDRAVRYRETEQITSLIGTAVNVQAMVFGNMGSGSGTGVLFSRNPVNGEHVLYGEYLINAQGEDVVAGIRTPEPISRLQEELPDAYEQLVANVNILETYYKDMQDIEFTIEEGKLFMLQTRSGKRAGSGAIKIALSMLDEGLVDQDGAIMMVQPEHLRQLLHPQFQDTACKDYVDQVITSGLAASPGAAVGRIVFTSEAAAAAAAEKRNVILVREATSAEDIEGMFAAQGVLTATGGYTSHASVVARGWGKPCVCGCNDLDIDTENEILTITTTDEATGEKIRTKLDTSSWISLNGNTGEVLLGQQTMKPADFKGSDNISRFMSMVDSKRKIRVLANADSPEEAEEARTNGAEGIGLTRTEHMFFAPDRINIVRAMILAKDDETRQKRLDELLVYQRADFEGILEAMDGLPVTVRLLDPPLHEFLPHLDGAGDIAMKAPVSVSEYPVSKVTESVEMSSNEAFAASVGMTLPEAMSAIAKMQEINPMLGFRGCRLGISFPQLVEMQARALTEAAINNKKKGLNPRCEIMIPLVGSANEYKNQADLIASTIEKVNAEQDSNLSIRIGTMIEVPRAAITSDEIAAQGASFFSYGTNDLTQMTFGISRDDVGQFFPTYFQKGIFEVDPFQTIDPAVERLMMQSATLGREAAAEIGNKDFKAGVCGEHAGDPVSVKKFAKSGLDYVSCSPFRVPLARLASAQAVVEEARDGNNVRENSARKQNEIKAKNSYRSISMLGKRISVMKSPSANNNVIWETGNE